MKNFAFATIAACSLIASANAGYTSQVIAFTDLTEWQNAPTDADISLFAPGYTAEYYVENFKGLASSGSSISGGVARSKEIDVGVSRRVLPFRAVGEGNDF